MTYYMQRPIVKKPSRAPFVLLILAAVAMALCVIGLITSISMGNDADARNALAPIIVPSDSASPTPGPATLRAQVVRSWGDGVWAVGHDDFKAGTYVTAVTEDGCYWARLKDFEGGVDSIIANGNLTKGAHGRFTVRKTDKGVEFSGGCTWTRTG